MPEYFIYKRQGPYGIKTLSQLVQNGEVDNNAFVWTPGMASLEYAKKLPELKPWFEEQDLETKKLKVEALPYAEAKTIAAPQSAVYKVAVNSQSTGPFSLGQLVEKIQAGEISPQTLVWKPGMPQWAPAQNVEDFTEAFAALHSAENPSPTREAVTVPESDDFAPADISFDEAPPQEISEQAPDQTAVAEAVPLNQPLSLLQENTDDILPWTKFILPGVLVLLGGVVTFLALKTAVLAAPLAKLASLFARFTKIPIEGEQGKALAEGATQAVPLLVKLIPGGLFVLAGIVVLVVTLLSRRSSEQYDPVQL
jgi:hypothetical protein